MGLHDCNRVSSAQVLSSALAVPAALAGAAALGALWAAVATTIHLGRRVHEVLVTLLLNFVAVLLVQQALAGPLGQFGAGFLQSRRCPPPHRFGGSRDSTRMSGS